MTRSALRVIALSGELEVGRRDEIAATLSLRGDESAVLIDLAEATYADSTTLASLLDLRAGAIENKVPVALVVANRQFSRLVEYAGLGHLFRIFGDRGAALMYLDGELAP